MEDKELVARILRNEDRNGCIAVIVERYQHMLLTVAARMLRSRTSAEDVVQDTWVVALRRLPRYDPERGLLSTWLCSITIGLCWHLWRTQKRVARGEDFERRCCIDEGPGPEERHELLVWHERLWAVLNKLTRFRQALLVLRLEEGWTYKQLAMAFGCTERHAEYETGKALAEAKKLGAELRLNHWRCDGAL